MSSSGKALFLRDLRYGALRLQATRKYFRKVLLQASWLVDAFDRVQNNNKIKTKVGFLLLVNSTQRPSRGKTSTKVIKDGLEGRISERNISTTVGRSFFVSYFYAPYRSYLS